MIFAVEEATQWILGVTWLACVVHCIYLGNEGRDTGWYSLALVVAFVGQLVWLN